MKRIAMAMLIGALCSTCAGNSDAQTKRITQLESALKDCRAQSCQADQGVVPAPSPTTGSTVSVQSVVPTIPVLEGQPVTAMVNPAESLKGLDQEFDSVNPDITDAHFLPEAGTTASVVLTPLRLHKDGEEWISIEEARKRMDALRSSDAPQGFRPATIRELRAFAKAQPEFQRRFLIVALGSSWVNPDGYRDVPCLGDWRGERGLDLGWTGSVWGSRWRFLAVRK